MGPQKSELELRGCVIGHSTPPLWHEEPVCLAYQDLRPEYDLLRTLCYPHALWLTIRNCADIGPFA